ncbi:hypothetical protein [Mastigocoleus sp. MO_188.B34]|nr:hypothetical protein [Mastigocoleus sp. MO_188.B34]
MSAIGDWRLATGDWRLGLARKLLNHPYTKLSPHNRQSLYDV